MKLLIASDIHGSAYWCRALMAQIEAESPDTVVLLGTFSITVRETTFRAITRRRRCSRC